MNPTSWLDIDLAALDANVAVIRGLIGAGTLLCGTVKADAYGLGVVPIARRLASLGLDMLAVYSPEQADQLASLSLPCPILVMMRMSELTRRDPLYRHAVTGRVHLTIHDRPQVAELDQVGRMIGCQLPIHLYVDTGMSRSGLDAAQLAGVLADLPRLKHIRLAGVYTHLASAECDEAFSDEQMARLDRLLAQHRQSLPEGLVVHAANTAATLRHPRYHRRMVRVGLGLYGFGGADVAPSDDPAVRRPPNPNPLPRGEGVRPIFRWLSRIIHVQDYPRGTPVGYNSTYRLTRDSVLGVVPVGYADGYPRSLSNKSVVGLPECTADGKPLYAPVLGRVNMDQIVIDLTDAPASVGALVEIVSDNPAAPNSLSSLAELAGSNCHEMLCRLSPRVARRYKP